MYLFKIKTEKSQIEGFGVFSLEKIPAGSVVWKFDQTHDKSLSQNDFFKLSREAQEELEKVGYLSPVSNMWIYPPENDPARFTNHHPSTNNLSVVFNSLISAEPFFKANRDITEGEELTVNYLEFDEFIKSKRPEWI
jgi:SET domain-containing protein